MLKTDLFTKILVIVLMLSFGLLVAPPRASFWVAAQLPNKPYLPVPIHDQATAIQVGRRIAMTEFAGSGSPAQVKLVSALRSTAADFEQRMAQAGVESTTWQRMRGDIWVVTFSGSFTPKHTVPGRLQPSIYNTFIVYLSAASGEVLGVTMRNLQD
jgi:hypothetical protein